MKKLILILLLLLGYFKSNAQSNLVLNPSFELKDSCPVDFDGIGKKYCRFWDSPIRGTPDYYNSCSNINSGKNIGFGVPLNSLGYQYAYSGNAYVGIVFNYWNHECVQGLLVKPLIIGNTYKVTFYVNNILDTFYRYDSLIHLGDTSYIDRISKDLGVGFASQHQDDFINPDTLVYVKAKVKSNAYINDTLNWVKVEGMFISDSAYNYIIIGNFNFNDTIELINQYNYYYIDSVSVIDFGKVGMEEEQQNEKINLYPNPCNKSLVISHQSLVNAIELKNVLGQLVYCEWLKMNTESYQLNTENLPNGIYFIKIIDANGKVYNAKFVKE